MPPALPILAATDFSPPARHAAERAACVAQEMGSALTLMHVLPGGVLQDLREWLGAGHASEQHLRDEAQRQLQAQADALRAQQPPPLDVRTVQAAGAVLEQIGREADALDAALLVLGARGAGFLRRLALGSTAERLLRRTTRPLLVVRQMPRGAYRRLLLALDFSPWSAPAIALTRQVAPRARLLLFHAYQVPFEEKLHFAGVAAATIAHYREQARVEATRRVHALAAAAGLQAGEWEPCIVEGEASMRIVEQEQAGDCDLLVLGKHGRSASEELLLGSVSQHVLAESSCDVLISTQRAG